MLILFYSDSCQMSKKIVNTINAYKLQSMFTMRQVEKLENIDLINAGVEIIPTVIDSNTLMYYEESEGLDLVIGLAQYVKYNQSANKIVTSENFIEDEEEKCAICMGEFEVGESVHTFFCSHKFHKECSTIWRKKKNCCPTCSKSLA